MSRLSDVVKEQRLNGTLRKDETVTNFMGGDSYVCTPLTTLKIITASSIFGEPSYYRDGGLGKNKSKSYLKCYNIWEGLKEFTLIPNEYESKTTTEIMTEAIDKALDYDFVGTLNWAVELRNEYNIRLNPQIIMVRAALHENRAKYTQNNGVDFRHIERMVMRRADEPMVQMAYYLYLNKGKKNKIPSILKRSWADKLSSLDAYGVNKYKNAEIGMINGVRICHAHSAVIDELMQTGSVTVDEEQTTWEQMRSAGKSWAYILENCRIGHMALLRNLRNIFTELNNVKIADAVIDELKRGVPKGKQFPFRYYTAYKMIKKSNINHKDIILDALEDCIDISVDNMPKMHGKVICLTDNSGSAWGSFTSEYGSVVVAEIDNLSAIITAKNSDEGYVGVFGDKLNIIPVSKHDKVLRKMEEVNNAGKHIGMSTENGIWIFFRDALKNKDKYNTIFIYSDMQAGHGGLYGVNPDEYKEYLVSYRGYRKFINVFKLLLDYRKTVNRNVNMFSVQTAGYDNVLIPETTYRCSIMSGWTGKECVYADAMIKIWDDMESNNKSRQ